MNTDKHWELHAQQNPYWAVVTWDKFKGNIDESPELLDEFFQMGRDYIKEIFTIIATSLSPSFTPKNALDFGCGVGRLLIPLAQRGLAVTGIDISETMLAVCGKNLTARKLAAVALTSSLDNLPEGNRYDLVHSFIVLQHIPVKKGLSIIQKLLNRVSDSGAVVLHFTYAAPEERLTQAYMYLVNTAKSITLRLGVLSSLYRAIRGRDMTPPLLMGNYPLNTIFTMLHDAHFNNIHIRQSLHGTHKGLIVFAQRAQNIPHPQLF
jgi:2-polyprenyl-3-methyl-5-hydroxy-6-metoxy-1,4-benzoquinol methylase